MPGTEEVFADGSRLVQTKDGSWLILETDFAACHFLSLVSEGTAHYNAPAPHRQTAGERFGMAASTRLEAA